MPRIHIISLDNMDNVEGGSVQSGVKVSATDRDQWAMFWLASAQTVGVNKHQ